MAHIERRTLEDGKTYSYRARYRDPSGHERVRTFSKKRDAERFLVTVEADKARGQWLDPKAGRVTFETYAKAWQKAQHHRPGTQESVDNALRVHLLPAFGPRPLASIRPTEVRQFTRDLTQRGYAPSTVKRLHAYLAMILKAAVEDQILARSPAVGTAPPTPERRQVEILTSEQLAALIAATAPRFRALVALGAGTGMRQGECFGLALSAPGRPGLDLLRRRVEVAQQVTLDRSRPKLTAPKTKASRRTIPLAPSLVTILAEHLTAYPVTNDDGVIFTGERGGLLRRSAFNGTKAQDGKRVREGVWQAALHKAGLPAGVTFHWLRHTFASHMIDAGATPLELQRLLGHRSIVETMDTYGSLFPDAEDTSRALIEKAMGKALRPPGEAEESG